jgi:hypothetical protein
MTLFICPGIHPPQLTQQFLAQMQISLDEPSGEVPLIFPAERLPPYSPLAVSDWLMARGDRQRPLIIIAFSAGVVGAMAAAGRWQLAGYPLGGMVAMDGWGVVLHGPVARMSHDAFTHWTSIPLGGGSQSFYAEPPVSHLDLWRSPQTTTGWGLVAGQSCGGLPAYRYRTTAAAWLQDWLHYAGSLGSPVPPRGL